LPSDAKFGPLKTPGDDSSRTLVASRGVRDPSLLQASVLGNLLGIKLLRFPRRQVTGKTRDAC